MKIPQFTDPQFLDAAGVGGMNAAFGSVSGAIAAVGSGFWAGPGLVAPEAMGLTFSGMVGTAVLSNPWGLVTSGGVLVKAHGTLTGADTQTYTANFSGFVPSSGSVTAYLAATVTQIQQDSFPLTGPPQGHPSFNVNFEPSVAYASNVFTVSVTAVTGGIDNINTFEIARTTLSPSQSAITTYSAAGWARAPLRKTWPSAVLATGGVLTVPQSQWMILPAVSGLTHTLPSVATAGGLVFNFANPGSGTWTIAASGLDTIAGLGSGSTLSSIAIPPYGTLAVWGNAVSGLWEVQALNARMMASLPNFWSSPQVITDNAGGQPLSLQSSNGSVGVNLQLVGNGGTTPNKYIGVYNGVLRILNSAFSAAIATLDDVGNFSTAANAAAGGLVITGSGLIASGLTVGSTTNLTPGQGGVVVGGYDAGGMNMRIVTSGYGVGWRSDGTNLYLGMTAQGSPFGSFNSLRPITVNLASGSILIDQSGAGVQFGGNVQASEFLGLTAAIGGVTLPGAGNINLTQLNATGLVQGATVQSFAGNVTANNGWLQATNGCLTPGSNANSAAIKGDFLNSISPSAGYQYLPSGLIIQWMTVTLPGNSTPAAYTLPLTFPHGCTAAWGSYESNLPPSAGSCGFSPLSASQIQAVNTGVGGSNGCTVWAIGT